MLTFADWEFNGKHHKTRKEIFLARMDALLPWATNERQNREFGSKALTGFGHCFSVPADPPPVPQVQALPLVSRR